MKTAWLVLLIPGVLAAQAAKHPITLKEALQAALDHHPRLQQARFEVGAAEARVRQARSGFFPQVDAGGLVKQGLSGSGNLFGLHGLASSPNPDDAALSMNFYQDIFDFGRTKYAKQARELELDALREAVLFERTRVVRDVTMDYFAALKIRQSILRAETQKTEKELELRRQRALFGAQLASRLEVTRAETKLAESNQQLDAVHDSFAEALAGLRKSMGVESSEFDSVEPVAVEVGSLPALDFWLGKEAQRADLRALDGQIAAQEEWVNRAEKEKNPRFMGMFSGGWTRFAELTAGRLLFGGLGLRLPIFTGKRLAAQVEEARQYLEKRRSQRRELAQRIRFQIEAALLQLRQLAGLVPPGKDLVRQDEQAVRLARVRQQAGLANLADVAQAESKLADSRSKLAVVLFDYAMKRAELDFAGGAPNP